MIDVFAFIIGLALAFQLITAMLLFILGKNTPFVFLVNKLYENEPNGIYDRFMNGFYYLFFLDLQLFYFDGLLIYMEL